MSLLHYIRITLTALFVIFSIVACGGGGGNGTGGTDVNESVSGGESIGAVTVDSDQSGGDIDAEEIDDSSNVSGEETVTDDSPPEVTVDIDPEDTESEDTETVGENPGGIDTPSDTTTTVGGKSLLTIAATGIPAIGVADSVMTAFDEVVLNDDGLIAFSGSYRTNNTTFNAVWFGPIDSPSLLIKTTDELQGVAPNIRFASASGLRLTTEGQLGMTVTLTGADSRTGYAIANQTDVQLVVVPGISNVTGHDGVVRTITDVTEGVPSEAGVALRVIGNNSSLLMINQNGENTFVAEALRFQGPVIPQQTIQGVSCPFGLGSRLRPQFEYLDNGDLYFEIDESSESGTIEGCGGPGVTRYRDGQFFPILASGDSVPGTADATFTSLGAGIDLLGAEQNGTALIGSGINAPVGFSVERRASVWEFPVDGSPNLVLLEGEEVEVATRAGEFPSFNTRGDSLVWSNGRFAVVDSVASTLVLLAGDVRSGQPHADLSAPGATSLQRVVSSDGGAPEGFSDSTFFSGIVAPALGRTNELLFVGELTDAVSNQVVDQSLWFSDLEGGLSRLLSTGDVVSIQGVEEPIRTGFGGNQGLVVDGRLSVTGDGSVVTVVLSSTSSSLLSNREALVFMPQALP